MDFLEKLLDPLFGDIQDQTTTRKFIPRAKPEPKCLKGKNSTFMTSVAVNTEKPGCTMKPPQQHKSVPMLSLLNVDSATFVTDCS